MSNIVIAINCCDCSSHSSLEISFEEDSIQKRIESIILNKDVKLSRAKFIQIFKQVGTCKYAAGPGGRYLIAVNCELPERLKKLFGVK